MAQLDIESIAKAIHADRCSAPLTWERDAPTMREFYRLCAVAAVKAMRDPSDRMLIGAHSNALGGSEAVPIWKSMIDELLKSA